MKTNPVTNIPTYNAPTESWISWHESLKDNFGKKIANQLWLKAWLIRGNSKANTVDLRKYLDKNGIKISESAWDKIADTGSETLDFFGNAFRMGRYAGMAVGGALLLIVLYALFNIAKEPGKAVGTALKL